MKCQTSITNRDSSHNMEINTKDKLDAVSNLLIAVVLLWWLLYVMASLFRSIFVSLYQDNCLVELAAYQIRGFYWINTHICLALTNHMCRCDVPAGLSVSLCVEEYRLVQWKRCVEDIIHSLGYQTAFLPFIFYIIIKITIGRNLCFVYNNNNNCNTCLQ